MINRIERRRECLFFRMVSAVSTFTFVFSLILPPVPIYAQQKPNSILNLPIPGSMVLKSEGYTPAVLKGIKVHPENPLRFDFIVDTGDSKLSGGALADESNKMIRYFLASITVPEKELWVNLSPYESDRIIPDKFGETEMGRDLLAQDYLLKQLMASMIYPENNLGKEFWDRVYARAQKEFGTTNIPINTFNKVWIIPDGATVLEYQGSAFVVKSHLKVMLEEDYLALQKNLGNKKLGTSQISEDYVKGLSNISSKVVKEILIPEIEKEVNQGKNFANLRQVYNAVVLASWYKENLKTALLNQIYANKNKVLGVDVEDKAIKQKIYEQYLEAFKKGVYNYIKKDFDQASQKEIPRKYFSGGVDWVGVREGVNTIRVSSPAQIRALPQEIQQAMGPSSPVGTLAVATADLVENTTSALAQKAVQVMPPSSSPVDLAAKISAMPKLTAEQLQKVLDYFKAKLNLGTEDVGYLRALYSKLASPREELKIGSTLVPTTYLTAQQKAAKGIISREEIRKDEANREAAKGVTVRIVQMNGGVGSSFKRLDTVKRVYGRDKLSAKGVDSPFEGVQVAGYDRGGNEVQKKETVSVAELKLGHYIYLANRGVYKAIRIQELVNTESKGPIEEFYRSPYLLDRVDDRRAAKRSYGEVISQTPGLSLATEMIEQGVLPNIDATTGQFIDDETTFTPGGHGFLGTLMLNQIATNAPAQGEQVITVITNGDGTNNFATEDVLGWMARNRIPIVMFTTTRTVLDAKGGVFGLEKAPDYDIEKGGTEGLPLQIWELAQSKTVGQEPLFQELGLTEGKTEQEFNTNISAENETVLHPFLKRLKEIIGEEEFFKITTPDYIANPKKKKVNGVESEVFQLEGAKGSALLNLNKYVTTTTNPQVRALMKEFGFKQLVYLVNYSAEQRTDVFTPEKYVWDHGVYARTDLFKPDLQTGRLVKVEHEGVPRDRLPGFEFEGAEKGWYGDMENINRAWGENLSISGLVALTIQGAPVLYPNAILRGEVRIENKSGKLVDLTANKSIFPTDQQGRIVLDNVYVVVDELGKITMHPYSFYEQLKLAQRAANGNGTNGVSSPVNAQEKLRVLTNLQNVPLTPTFRRVEWMGLNNPARLEFHDQAGRLRFLAFLQGEAGGKISTIFEARENGVYVQQNPVEGNQIEKFRAIKEPAEQQQWVAGKVSEMRAELAKNLSSSPVVKDMTTLLNGGARFVGVTEVSSGKYQYLSLPSQRTYSVGRYGPYYTGASRFIQGLGAAGTLLRYLHQQIAPELSYEQWQASVKRPTAGVEVYPYKSLEELREIYAFQINEGGAWYLAGFYGDSEATEDIAVVNLATMAEITHFKNPHYAYTGRADIRVNGEKGTVEFFGQEVNPDVQKTDVPTLKVTVQLPERAITSPVASSAITTFNQNPGGINLDPALLNLQIKRDKNWVPLPVEQQPSLQQMNINGFYPVIINVTPLPSLPMFLGLEGQPAPAAEDEGPTLDFSFLQLSPVEHLGRWEWEEAAI